MYSTLWNIRNTLINNIPRRFEFSEIEHASQIRKNALYKKSNELSFFPLSGFLRRMANRVSLTKFDFNSKLISMHE